jgi:hypothetical protein
MACDSSGLVLTVPPVDFAAIAASVTITGKSGHTAAVSTADLSDHTCSRRFGAASWTAAGDTATFSVAAGTSTACNTSPTAPAVAM